MSSGRLKPRGMRGLQTVSRKEACNLLRRVFDEDGVVFYSVVMNWEADRLLLPGGDIIADRFLEAMKAFLLVLDALGTAFKVVRRDLNKHLVKVGAACSQHKTETLSKMMDADGPTGDGSVNLNWLKRVLQFTDMLVANFLDGERLPDAAEKAYMGTLYHAHSRIVRALCKNIRFITPEGSTFCRRLYPKDEAIVILGMRELLFSLRPTLQVLMDMTNRRKTEDVHELQHPPRPVPATILASLG